MKFLFYCYFNFNNCYTIILIINNITNKLKSVEVREEDLLHQEVVITIYLITIEMDMTQLQDIKVINVL